MENIFFFFSPPKRIEDLFCWNNVTETVWWIKYFHSLDCPLGAWVSLPSGRPGAWAWTAAPLQLLQKMQKMLRSRSGVCCKEGEAGGQPRSQVTLGRWARRQAQGRTVHLVILRTSLLVMLGYENSYKDLNAKFCLHVFWHPAYRKHALLGMEGEHVCFLWRNTERFHANVQSFYCGFK